MKLSYRWLSELVDLAERTPAEIAHLITFRIAEVEGLEAVGQFPGVITAKVCSVDAHPQADRLSVCRLDVGHGEMADEVVCGAPNVAPGQTVAFAPVGTTLVTPDGPLTLEARKVRGVVSHGMICAEDELGLGEDHSGILVLPEETPIGAPFGEALALSDTIIDIGNTSITHRPDLWGHVGFARELGAVLRSDVDYPSVEVGEAMLAEAKGEPYPVAIDDEEGCRRYVGLVLDGLSNGPSPLALRWRLACLGVRSIDLLVDLTNQVLLEQGQPLHGFDLRAIHGDRIIVRRGRDGETMASLDGVLRTLTPEDVVIADADRPIAIAGLMGGQDAEVREDTTSLLLEAATFDPVRVRRSSARLGLRTEASSRFEKSLDAELPMTAALRFASLVKAHVPDATIDRPISDVYPTPYPTCTIEMPYRLVRRRLGLRLNEGQLRRWLTSLGFKVKDGREVMTVTVPSWRATKDIEGPEDLVEEIGRLEGYDKVPIVQPLSPVSPTLCPKPRKFERAAGAILSLDLGYTEVKNYSFYGPKDVERVGLVDVPHIELQNPLTEGNDRLVQTLVPNLLREAGRNQGLAERGRMWESARLIPPGKSDALPDETHVMGLIAWDNARAEDPDGVVFRSLIQDARLLLHRLRVLRVSTIDGDAPPLATSLPAPVWLHPGRRASLRSGTPDLTSPLLAVGGEVAPAVSRAYGLQGRLAVVEIHLATSLVCADRLGSCYTPVLRYPVVPFDVSLLVPRRTSSEIVANVIRDAVNGQVRNIRLFDQYEGEGVPDGQRSLAFRCELFDPQSTLSSKSAEKLRTRVIEALSAAGWTVRTA